MIYGALCHRRALDREAGLTTTTNQKTYRYYALFAQYRAVQLLRQDLEKFQDSVPDSVLLAMLSLGCYQWDEANANRMSAFQPSFQFLQSQDIFIQFEPEDTHVFAVFNLLKNQGGLESLSFPGIAAGFS